MWRLAKGGGVYTDLTEDYILYLIEQVVGFCLILNIKEKLAIFDGEVESLFLCAIVDPKSDGKICIDHQS